MKVVVKIADIFSHSILVLFMLLVLFTAISSSLLRYYLPKADDYRDVILANINHRYPNNQFTAARIAADWHAFSPELKLFQASIINDKDGSRFDMGQMAIEIDLFKSLLNGHVHFNRIDVSSLDLMLEQDALGKWSLAGIAKKKNPAPIDVQKIENILWAISGLRIESLQLQLKPHQPRPKPSWPQQ